MRRPSRPGFSLIELMIVAAIISILASIAIPHYYHFQLRSKRSEVYLTIGKIRVSEEAFKATNDNYAACATVPAGPPSLNRQPWVAAPCPAACNIANVAACNSFECIGFTEASTVFYQYGVGVLLSPVANPTPEMGVGAVGDLDADGAFASYSVQTNNAQNPLGLGQCADGISACPIGSPAELINDCTPTFF